MHLVTIGGSDAGISAALRARELDPGADVSVVVADAYPNFSICGIPYYVSGEVTHWRNLAHRTTADLEATGMRLRLDTTTRGLHVIQMEQLPEVLPTVNPPLGALVHGQLAGRGVEVLTGTTVRQITPTSGEAGRLQVEATAADGTAVTRQAGMVLVVVGVRPDTSLAASAGATLGTRGAIAVDRGMRTNLPDVFAAGDCVVTHHRLLGETYLPLGTTAHKQGRVAGENALGGIREFAGSLGTQVVKIFDQAAARTGLRDHEAAAAGYDPVTVQSEADDHKAYYPGSHRITMRFTGDRTTGRLLGVQLFGHRTPRSPNASTSPPPSSSTP